MPPEGHLRRGSGVAACRSVAPIHASTSRLPRPLPRPGSALNAARAALEAIDGPGDWKPILREHRVGAGRVVDDAPGHDIASLAHPTRAQIVIRAAFRAAERTYHAPEIL
jgi:hypothetical protein